MGIVTLEFDNTLTKSEIVVPLVTPTKSEGGEEYSSKGLTDRAQTTVFGIQSPLIMISNTVIDFDAVNSFELSSTGTTPTLSLMVEDKYNLVDNIDKLKHGSEVRIQILPRFDNAYKKIDLTFDIVSADVKGPYIRLTGSYKSRALTTTQLIALGRLSTYDLFKSVAMSAGLGFATNVVGTNDPRYIYCDNKSLLSILSQEISKSDAKTHVLDWWIDFWDNINLVDVKDRYVNVDSDDDLRIWIAGDLTNTSDNVETDAQEMIATINNHPVFVNSELYVTSYSSKISPGIQIGGGTDKVVSIYSESLHDYEDYFFQDGDIKNNISIKYEYLGENYGDYNYLYSEQLRSRYMQKMNAEEIKVSLQSPLLGLMRGHKVNFIRYVNNDLLENKISSLEADGLIDRNVQSNINLDDYDVATGSQEGDFRIDRTVSGQYLIKGVSIKYLGESWRYELTLIKPSATKPSIFANNIEQE